VATVVTIKPGSLGAFIKGSVGKNAKAVQTGVRRGAMRTVALLTRKTPVDQGIMKNAWKYVEVGGSVGSPVIARVDNSAPHAGIVERGARPHMPPLEPILEWVKRHLRSFGFVGPHGAPRWTKNWKQGPLKSAAASARRDAKRAAMMRDHLEAVADYEDEVLKLAEAIRWKIFKHGQKGLFIVRNSLDEIREIVNDEVTKAVARALAAQGD
jgi:hypothetical protein